MYTGHRCQNIHSIPSVESTDVSKKGVVNVRSNFAEDTSDSMTSGWKTHIVTAVVSGFGCMLVVFISVFIRYKRFVFQKFVFDIFILLSFYTGLHLPHIT